MIALVAATKEEIDGIGQHITKEKKLTNDGYYLWKGMCRDKKVLLVQTGMGRERVERAVQLVLESHPVTALVSLGMAGALTQELAVGDIVLCTDVYCSSVDRSQAECYTYRSNADLVQKALQALDGCSLTWFLGSSVTVPELSFQACQKRALSLTVQAEVCEMEDFWIAQVAEQCQVPFLAVRVVYDVMHKSLPPFDRLVDSDGTVKLNWAIPYLLTHPGHLFNAPALYRYSRRAKRSLATFVRSFLEKL